MVQSPCINICKMDAANGLCTGCWRTLDEIAAELGISKERVRQIRESAVKKLRGDLLVLSAWQSLIDDDARAA